MPATVYHGATVPDRISLNKTRWVINKEIELVIIYLSTKKEKNLQNQIASMMNSTKQLKKKSCYAYKQKIFNKIQAN